MKIGAQVLNGMYGQSADGVRVRLERASDDGWELVASAQTDGAGRIPDWNGLHLDGGLYRIVFDSDSYFAGLGASTAYPEVLVVFRLQSESDVYQIQLTLSPYSYSTHFGAERQLYPRQLEKGQSNDSVRPRTAQSRYGCPQRAGTNARASSAGIGAAARRQHR